jgi:hypothetical protein
MCGSSFFEALSEGVKTNQGFLQHTFSAAAYSSIKNSEAVSNGISSVSAGSISIWNTFLHNVRNI